MDSNNRKIINEYKNYLIKSKENSTEIFKNIKTIKDLIEYKNQAILEFENLEELNLEYKLYDKNYESFRIAMGKFAIALNKSFKLQLSESDKIELTNEFIKLNSKFEVLFQKNILKDAYIWK